MYEHRLLLLFLTKWWAFLDADGDGDSDSDNDMGETSLKKIIFVN